MRTVPGEELKDEVVAKPANGDLPLKRPYFPTPTDAPSPNLHFQERNEKRPARVKKNACDKSLADENHGGGVGPW